MPYNFATLDPRNVPAAQEANDKIFANGNVLGVEVTVPALAARCDLGNIDPQHSGGDASRAAIEDAFMIALPPNGATLVTVRADLDSIGAMAIISLSSKDRVKISEECSGLLGRVYKVAESDKFARGGYPGPRALPSSSDPWPEATATAESSRELAAIAAAVMDFKLSLAERIEMMERWLETGEEPQSYRDRVEAERADMIKALESGAIKASTVADGKIAIVESTHRAATSVGYALAPVVIALNPTFRFQGGEPHAKFTICQFTGGFADLKAVAIDLNEREAGWGGSPTIIGSPQGVSSQLTIYEVAEVVTKRLK